MPSSPHGKPDKSSQFVSLLAAVERQLSGYVLALVPNLSDADEVLQETKIRLWEQFDKYNPEKSFSAWAQTIAYFQVLTFRKRSQRQKLVFSDELVSLLSDDFPGSQSEPDDRSEALLSCLAALSEKPRKLLKDYYGGTPLERAAEKLQMNATAAKKAIYRARLFLRECIERRMCGEEALGK